MNGSDGIHQEGDRDIETGHIKDLRPDDKNARRHNPRNIGMVVDSLQQVGAARSIVINGDNVILAGNGVIEAAAEAGIERVRIIETDGNEIIAVKRDNLTPEQERQLAYYDNRTSELADWDAQQIVADLEDGFEFEGMFYEEELQDILGEAADDILGESGSGDMPDDALEWFAPPTPDALFASDNEWDVPTLLPELEADFLELPLTRWGEISRKSKMPGTYHFYTDDYKFNALWSDPADLIGSQCAAMIEPNCSTNDQMPMAVGLWGIYRKRWLARYAQEYGVKVWVDLNVSPKFREVNMLGVPRGWRSFATRGLDKYVGLLDEDYALACEWVGDERPRFLVYGGSSGTEERCKERGWLYLPENIHVKEGRMVADYG